MPRYIRRRTDDGVGAHKGAVPIGKLFEKYRKRLLPPPGVVITVFCAVVEKEVGVMLTSSNVRYTVHTRTLAITTFGPQKNEIKLHSRRILELCRETLGERGAPQQIL